MTVKERLGASLLVAWDLAAKARYVIVIAEWPGMSIIGSSCFIQYGGRINCNS
jgi:hypothetical protein